MVSPWICSCFIWIRPLVKFYIKNICHLSRRSVVSLSTDWRVTGDASSERPILACEGNNKQNLEDSTFKMRSKSVDESSPTNAKINSGERNVSAAIQTKQLTVSSSCDTDSQVIETSCSSVSANEQAAQHSTPFAIPATKKVVLVPLCNDGMDGTSVHETSETLVPHALSVGHRVPINEKFIHSNTASCSQLSLDKIFGTNSSSSSIKLTSETRSSNISTAQTSKSSTSECGISPSTTSKSTSFQYPASTLAKPASIQKPTRTLPPSTSELSCSAQSVSTSNPRTSRDTMFQCVDGSHYAKSDSKYPTDVKDLTTVDFEQLVQDDDTAKYSTKLLWAKVICMMSYRVA